MTKHVLIPVANGTEDIEAVTIIDILRRSGAQVTVASVEATTVTCVNGTRLVADKKLSECAEQTFDLIALPGGDVGAQHLRDNPQLVSMMKAQDKAGRFLAAICASPAVVLEHHQLIHGRAATCYPSYADALANQTKINERVVVDGNLITSRSPGTAFEFALKLVECVVGADKAKQIAQGTLAS